MFSIFRKKRYLADLLGDFVDIHNHILPGIDDGAQNVEESLALIRGFQNLGIRHFVTTPHIHPLYPNTRKSIANAHQKLMSALMDHQITNVVVATAAEHMIDENFEELLNTKQYQAHPGRYLLVETSFLQSPLNFDEAIVQVARNQLIPILAHPERYQYLHQNPRRYRELKEKGIAMQLNLLSLGEYYEKEVQKMSFKLLDEGLVDFLASDIHNIPMLKALKEISLPKKRIEQLRPLLLNTVSEFY